MRHRGLFEMSIPTNMNAMTLEDNTTHTRNTGNTKRGLNQYFLAIRNLSIFSEH